MGTWCWTKCKVSCWTWHKFVRNKRNSKMHQFPFFFKFHLKFGYKRFCTFKLHMRSLQGHEKVLLYHKVSKIMRDLGSHIIATLVFKVCLMMQGERNQRVWKREQCHFWGVGCCKQCWQMRGVYMGLGFRVWFSHVSFWSLRKQKWWGRGVLLACSRSLLICFISNSL